MNLFGGSEVSPAEIRREAEVKAGITKTLKEALKSLQQQHSTSNYVIQSEDIANVLCSSLEAVFLHGLKDALMKSFGALFSSGTREFNPSVNFWNFVRKFTHRDVVEQLKRLKQITTNVGLSRAWLRQALNDGLLESYLQGILADTKSLRDYYNSTAYLRDPEYPDILLTLSRGVSDLQFRLPCNSAVLNLWTSTPLMLAGLVNVLTLAKSGVNVTGAASRQSVTEAEEAQDAQSSQQSAASHAFSSAAIPFTPPNTPYDSTFLSMGHAVHLAGALDEGGLSSTPTSQASHPDFSDSLHDTSVFQGVPELVVSRDGQRDDDDSLIVEHRHRARKGPARSPRAVSPAVVARSNDGNNGNNESADDRSLKSFESGDQRNPFYNSMLDTDQSSQIGASNVKVSGVQSQRSAIFASLHDIDKAVNSNNIVREASQASIASSQSDSSCKRQLTEESDASDAGDRPILFPPPHPPAFAFPEHSGDAQNADQGARDEEAVTIKVTEGYRPVVLPDNNEEEEEVSADTGDTITNKRAYNPFFDDADETTSEPSDDRRSVQQVANGTETLSLNLAADKPVAGDSSVTPDATGAGAQRVPVDEEEADVMANAEDDDDAELSIYDTDSNSRSNATASASSQLPSHATGSERTATLAAVESAQQQTAASLVADGEDGENEDGEEEEEERDEVLGNSLLASGGWSSSGRRRSSGVAVARQPSTDTINLDYSSLLDAHQRNARAFPLPLTSSAASEAVESSGSDNGAALTWSTRSVTVDKSDVVRRDTDVKDYEVIEVIDVDVTSLPAHVTEEMRDAVTVIARERGLHQQNYQCHACGRLIGVLYGKPRVCTFTGFSYCTECHLDDYAAIPAYMVHNWDFKKYPVCQQSVTFLQRTEHEPLLDIDALSPQLYSHVPELDKTRVMRVQLRSLKAYLFTCSEHVANELRSLVWPREYLYDDIHKYSPLDLTRVATNALQPQLKRIVNFALSHVYACRLCSQKGFICEVCHDSSIIYPFETDTTDKCDECKTVYHKQCKTKAVKCPRCERRQRYHQQQAKSAVRSHGDVVNYTLPSDDHVRMPSAV